MRTSLIVPMFVVGGALFAGCSSEETGTPPAIVPNGGGTSVGGSGGGTGMSTGGSGTGGAPAPGVGGSSAGGSGTGGAGTGGAGTGGAGTGGSAMGGAGGGGAGLSIETLFPTAAGFDGMTFSVACAEATAGDDCGGAGWVLNGAPAQACVPGGANGGNKLEAKKTWTVGGEVGKMYDVNMHFYGVMEPYVYTGVTRMFGNEAADLSGAKPAYATVNDPAGNFRQATDNKFNTYELHVKDDKKVTKAIHVFNSDTKVGHWTILVNFEKTIPVWGGGEVELVIIDMNCRQIKNCGTVGTTADCSQFVRTVDYSAAMPQPGTYFKPPALGLDNSNAGQWFIIDVKGVTAAAQ